MYTEVISDFYMYNILQIAFHDQRSGLFWKEEPEKGWQFVFEDKTENYIVACIVRHKEKLVKICKIDKSNFLEKNRIEIIVEGGSFKEILLKIVNNEFTFPYKS